MGDVLTFIFWTVFILFIYPTIVFVIWTIINRGDVDDWSNGCPPIHTIGDLIAAMRWRVHNTREGDMFNTPLFNVIAAIMLTITFILAAIILSLKWILEKLYLLNYIIKFGNFIIKQWNKFKNVTIFK